MIAHNNPCPVNVKDLLKHAQAGVDAHTLGISLANQPPLPPCQAISWQLGWFMADIIAHATTSHPTPPNKG